MKQRKDKFRKDNKDKKGGGKFPRREGGFKPKPRFGDKEEGRKEGRRDERPERRPEKRSEKRDDNRYEKRGESGARKWVENRGEARPDARDDNRGGQKRGEFKKPGFVKKKFEKKKFGGSDRGGNDRNRSDRFANTRPERSRDRDRDEPRFAGPKPTIYGIHACREAWLNPVRNIEALYLTENAAGGFEEAVNAAREAGLKRPAPLKIQKHDLDKLLPPGSSHQGVAMAAAPLAEIGVQDLIIRAGTAKKTVLLLLDQVTDPHNVGAILRSASALGASGVIMQKMHAPALEGALAKTACGAAEHMPVAYETNLSRAMEELKEGGFFIYGLDERGEKAVGAMQGDKIALALGAEGPGLRRLIKENCDELVRLPTQGPIQSLNVSNAAAIALYALLAK